MDLRAFLQLGLAAADDMALEPPPVRSPGKPPVFSPLRLHRFGVNHTPSESMMTLAAERRLAVCEFYELPETWDWLLIWKEKICHCRAGAPPAA